jgi:hypothetical protein
VDCPFGLPLQAKCNMWHLPNNYHMWFICTVGRIMSQYPKPQAPYTGYSDLYFATERQVRSWAAPALKFSRRHISESLAHFLPQRVIALRRDAHPIANLRAEFSWFHRPSGCVVFGQRAAATTARLPQRRKRRRRTSLCSADGRIAECRFRNTPASLAIVR